MKNETAPPLAVGPTAPVGRHPIEVKNVGGEAYILMSKGHHDVHEFMRAVRAASPASALMHVARDIARVAVASQDDLVECLSDGVRVESLGETQGDLLSASETEAA